LSKVNYKLEINVRLYSNKIMPQIIGYIGRLSLKTVGHTLAQFAFAYSLVKLMFNRPKTGRALVRKFTLEQIYFTGYQALYIIIPIALMIGSTNIIMFAKIPGRFDLGQTLLMLLVREIGPLATALVVILRSATAVTIEIGYMKVLHEIDAIEMAGIDPLRIVGLPRFFGIPLATLCLFVVFGLTAVLGGYVLAWSLTLAPMGSLLRQMADAATLADIMAGIIKALCFGITIAVVCLYRGFMTKSGITEIPVQTSKVAIECFFYCLVINVIISYIFFL